MKFNWPSFLSLTGFLEKTGRLSQDNCLVLGFLISIRSRHLQHALIPIRRFLSIGQFIAANVENQMYVIEKITSLCAKFSFKQKLIWLCEESVISMEEFKAMYNSLLLGNQVLRGIWKAFCVSELSNKDAFEQLTAMLLKISDDFDYVEVLVHLEDSLLLSSKQKSKCLILFTYNKFVKSAFDLYFIKRDEEDLADSIRRVLKVS
eukprot:snap_masked-scaffold_6-processed-gene-11.50-mRNA-1 protein AED:1.00 eAED:1.00 QI:0/-1/0/0/-1/1/1/0/204